MRGSPFGTTHHAWSPAATPGTRTASMPARKPLHRSPNRADASPRGSTRGAAAVRGWTHPRTAGELEAEVVWPGRGGDAARRPPVRRFRTVHGGSAVASSLCERSPTRGAGGTFDEGPQSSRGRLQRTKGGAPSLATATVQAASDRSTASDRASQRVSWLGRNLRVLVPAIGQPASARAARPDTEAAQPVVIRESHPGACRFGEGLLRPEPGRRTDLTGERSHDLEPIGRDRRLGGSAWSGARAVTMATSGQGRGRPSWWSGREGERHGEERHVCAGPQRRRSRRGSWSASSGSPRGSCFGRGRGAAKLRHVDDLKARPATSVATPRRRPGRAIYRRVRSFGQRSRSTGGA